VSDDKPLGIKAYGSISHLPGSRMGPGDHACHPGQATIACEKVRDKHDRIVVQEKTDGSCCAVAKINGEIVPLGRAGYRAITSPFEQHHLFHDWAMERADLFDEMLDEGERAIGEWLAQAHGTRYDLFGREPWVLFDIMSAHERQITSVVRARATSLGFASPPLLTVGPTSIEKALDLLGLHGHYGAIDPAEGIVWRVERDDKVDYLLKFVKSTKVDGCYLDSVTGKEPIWNWRPK
jgi:RNA ligase